MALEGLASGTPLRKRSCKSGLSSPAPSTGKSVNVTLPFTSGSAMSSVTGSVVGGTCGSTPATAGHDRRRKANAIGSSKKQKAIQELERGLEDGVDLLHSLANSYSYENLDTIEENGTDGAQPIKRQRTKKNSFGEGQRAHEECAAIISDMKSNILTYEASSTANSDDCYGKGGGSKQGSRRSVAIVPTSMPVPASSVLDATGSSLAAAAFGTPVANGGLSGGLNDICLALWSAAPLGGGPGVAHSESLGSPMFHSSFTAPHPTMHHGKYKKPGNRGKQGNGEEIVPSSNPKAGNMAGVVLNMDVVDYGSVPKNHIFQNDSFSPRSDEGLSGAGKSGSNFTTSESDCDPG